MSVAEVSISELLAIFTHIKKWVTNLLRAKAERKKESKKALRAVITAVRKTTLYVRNLQENSKKSVKKEEELSLLWTELSFKLEDLGLTKLSKRCYLKGRYWADPESFNEKLLERLKIRLKDIEQLAETSLKEFD
jgi:hypothetical protein